MQAHDVTLLTATASGLAGPRGKDKSRCQRQSGGSHKSAHSDPDMSL